MSRYLIPIFEKRDMPNWFARLNYLTLLPIILYPFALPISLYWWYIGVKDYLAIILLITYPVILIVNVLLSFKLYKNSQMTAIFLPCLAYIAMLYFICSLL